jgi:aspartate/methionine/tyrosine aminotransferase
MEENAPKEHYEALDAALQHKEVAETDREMYNLVRKERDRLREELDEIKRREIARQDDHK